MAITFDPTLAPNSRAPLVLVDSSPNGLPLQFCPYSHPLHWTPGFGSQIWSSEVCTQCNRLDLLITEDSHSPPRGRIIKACSVKLQRSYRLTWPMRTGQEWHVCHLFCPSFSMTGKVLGRSHSTSLVPAWSSSWAMSDTGEINLCYHKHWDLGALFVTAA